MIDVCTVKSRTEKRTFLTFPWRIYKGDPLWVPPLLPEKKKTIDPRKGKFFEDGYAELFIAWKDGKPAGTISCGEYTPSRQTHETGQCEVGFFECIPDYTVAEALFRRAEVWACAHGLPRMIGTFNLDREEGRGILIDGRDRPPALYCGHSPEYYREYFERYGFSKFGEDGLAYAIDLDLGNPEIQHLLKLAEKIRQRKTNIRVRGANLKDMDREIDRILVLQNRSLEHFNEFIPYTRASIEAMVLPMVDVVDPELVLFAEVDGKAAGWFPAVPNLNEVIIHLNGLRYPWDYLRALKFSKYKPKSLSIKSIAVLPEYWDLGVGVLLFDEMARRAMARGYTWLDMSLTGDENPDTWPLAHRMGAKIYKRYRFYQKPVN